MKIALVTDAWRPQTNGVVNTLANTVEWLGRFGHEVSIVSPEGFRTFACPTYPEIRVSWFPYRQLAARLDEFGPQAIHIATEGPLGFSARRWCLRRGLRFTTSYHTQFPQYLKMRFPIPLSFSYAALRGFHGSAERCMVSTATVQEELAARGFRNLARWGRGVDTDRFRPRERGLAGLRRPIAVYVGRLAIEKNVDAFLSMEWEGSKLVIGDGPERARLERKYPNARFAGFLFGEPLAQMLAAADVTVFPSRTDTFGLVNLEALACGVPVAAYPVSGPRDIIQDGITGALDEDLAAAAHRALSASPHACRAYALRFGWESITREFEANLAPNPLQVHATAPPLGFARNPARRRLTQESA